MGKNLTQKENNMKRISHKKKKSLGPIKSLNADIFKSTK